MATSFVRVLLCPFNLLAYRSGVTGPIASLRKNTFSELFEGASVPLWMLSRPVPFTIISTSTTLLDNEMVHLESGWRCQ